MSLLIALLLTICEHCAEQPAVHITDGGLHLCTPCYLDHKEQIE